jgi:hypothetical protein
VVSQKITNHINEHFNSDRQKAITVCFKQLKESLGIDIKTWKSEYIEYAKQLAILFHIHPNSKIWQQKHKKNIQLLIQLKSAKTELPWVKHLQKFDAFWEYIK